MLFIFLGTTQQILGTFNEIDIVHRPPVCVNSTLSLETPVMIEGEK